MVEIDGIEIGTVANLPELQHLLLEKHVIRPFKSESGSHLLRFYCRCECSWFRKWVKQNPFLFKPKEYGVIFLVGNLKNLEEKRTDTFSPLIFRGKILIRLFLVNHKLCQCLFFAISTADTISSSNDGSNKDYSPTTVGNYKLPLG